MNHLKANGGNSRIQIYRGAHIDFSIIQKSLVVYKQYFGEEGLEPAQEYFSLHQYNPDMYYYAIDSATEDVVGNLEVIPFEDDYLEEFEKGKHDSEFVDGSYPIEKIRQYNLPGFYSIVVELIAVARRFHGDTAVLRALLSSFIERLLEFSKDDIFVKDIYTDVYTDEGRKLAQYFGFKPIRSSIDGRIYKTTLLPPEFLSQFPSNIKKLRTAYSKKFEQYGKLIQSQGLGSKATPPVNDTKWEYSVALSFAGEQRDYVEKVAVELRKLGVAVFYDFFEQDKLWGKDLYQHLNDIYKNKSRYCIVFVSHAYVQKLWTRHEIKGAQNRAFMSDQEYILPVRMEDGVELPGLNSTVGYVDGRRFTPRELAELTLRKVDG